jgi:hypothetical protein
MNTLKENIKARAVQNVKTFGASTITVLLLFLLFFSSACRDDGEYKKYLVGQIKKMSDLTLVEVKFKKYLILKQNKEILFFSLKTSTQVMCIYPRIKLGVSLDQITEKDVTIDENSKNIRMELPPISVKEFEYDSKDYGDVDASMTKNYFGNSIKIESIELMHRYAENEVRKSINIPELRSICEKKARTNLQAFFASLGFSVDVVFKPSTERYLMSFEPGLTGNIEQGN